MVMEFKFSKDSAESQEYKASDDKGRQRALLVLLLVLVGGFAYLYFFTGLIKPLEVPKGSEVSVAAPAPQAVKMPLPARAGEPEKTDGKKGAGAETPKTVVTAPGPATPPAPPLPVAVPVVPAPKPEAKPVPAAAKPATESKKAEAPKPSIQTNQNAEAGKGAGKKTVPHSRVKAKAVATAKKAAPRPCFLVVGNYVIEEALAADMGHVRKAGLVPIVKPSVHKKTAMNRLFVAEFNDRAAAQPTLEKLKHHTSDAFVIKQGGRFSLYAGSYLQKDAAVSEKERLKAAGISVTVRQSDIAIPSRSLSVGPFKSRKDADEGRDRLKNVGIKATLSQK